MIAFSALFCSCEPSDAKVKTIIVQPLGNVDTKLISAVFKSIKEVNPSTILKPAINIPLSSYYAPRKRYRADIILDYLDNRYQNDTITIGLTSRDISTTKNGVYDWGVMGLGFCPGNVCVASTFRLSKKNLKEQFYKVAIHELGHTQGLPHCEDKSCFMRDAEGGNPLNEEHGFCEVCKLFLKSKGWELN
jgi:archaemetzincin